MTQLTTKQAALLLGLSQSYVKTLVRLKTLPATKPGHDIFIERKDVLAYKRKRQRKQQGK